MPFWTYMLHCADRSFYVGHTDDIELRLAEHHQAGLGGYTASRLPVKLVWCSEFPSRYEALSAERQIKGWSRAKKLALIREDWETIGRLARSKEEKERASTSSARTGEGGGAEGGEGALTPTTPVRPEPVEGPHFLNGPPPTRLPLKLHPESRCEAVAGIEVELVRAAPHALSLRYLVIGMVGDLLLPPQDSPGRSDGLWQHTCLEAFLRRPSKPGYCEFNFAPSNLWAAYRFHDYRSGMEPLEVQPPRIETNHAPDRFELRAELDSPGEGPWQLALSAVMEETNGRKSYWALAHPAAKPDFHHPDSFVHELP